MKILKPKFWESNNILISFMLIPISFLFQLIILIKKKTTYENSFNIPVICVGNIYLGGTGKTPLSILITKELKKNNKRPAIIKKFYSNHYDEHNLINNSLDCLFLDKDRSIAIKKAEKKQYDIVILDDGFQDYSIKKDLSILCFNSNQLIGNGKTLPAGPLREKIDAVKKAQIVIINGSKNDEEFKKKNLLAFAGIGNPENFFKLLADNNLNVQKKLSFPDHYNFSRSNIKELVEDSIKNTITWYLKNKSFLD